MRTTKLIWLAGMVFMLASMTDAMAQRGGGGRGGPRLDPAKAAAAQELQAKEVAKVVGLSGDATGKLVAAYKAARESAAPAGGRGGGGRGGGGRGGFGGSQVVDEEKAKLKTAISEFLSDDEAGEASDALAVAFSRRTGRSWDRMVDVLASFSLGDEKLFSTLTLVRAYAVDSDKAFQDAIANQDFQSIGTATQAARDTLDGALASILSEEQLAKWKEDVPAGGGFGGRRGGGGFRGN
ncbi:hypothetical protein IIC65_00285 [Candidatus Sumerlaeota bacterium]|nr:hypothetical protein [Candidatus Sumerlaeota bacterium]